nr:unnamed protein product [Spirometra erinaceieuropaei]
MQLPEDLHLPPIHPVENVDTYASRMRKTLRISSEEARLHLQEGQRRQKAFYDRLAHGTPYQEGDIVWMLNFAPSPSVPQNFNPAWIGPCVSSRISRLQACLQFSGTIVLRQMSGQMIAWMAKPPTNVPCPPGLEYLLSLDKLVVKQKKEMLEIFTGFETANKYVVLNAFGQQVFYAMERNDLSYQVLTADGNHTIGIISKKWTGFLQEYLTDADTYAVTFPVDLQVTAKALLMAATFLIDFMFFENSQRSGQ